MLSPSEIPFAPLLGFVLFVVQGIFRAVPVFGSAHGRYSFSHNSRPQACVRPRSEAISGRASAPSSGLRTRAFNFPLPSPARPEPQREELGGGLGELYPGKKSRKGIPQRCPGRMLGFIFVLPPAPWDAFPLNVPLWRSMAPSWWLCVFSS